MALSSQSAEPTTLHLDALHIQAASVVAQQTALTEWEIELNDRASALNLQESQLADRLEERRRELLNLQDQISRARVLLRESRASVAILSEQQNQAARSQSHNLAEKEHSLAQREARLLALWRKFKRRIKRQQAIAQQQQLQRQALIDFQVSDFAQQRTAFIRARERFNGDAELEKRRLIEADTRLQQRQQAIEIQSRDWIRRTKELAVAERQQLEAEASAKTRHDELLREIEMLDRRAANARRSLGGKCERLPTPESPAVSSGSAQTLSSCAAKLADQGAVLLEHIEAFAAIRAETMIEFDDRARDLNEKETQLDQRERLLLMRERAIEQSAERMAAKKVIADRAMAEVKATIEKQQANLAGDERRLSRRQAHMAEWYQRWGRRRGQALATLDAAIAEQIAGRDYWATLRDTWLRARARLLRDQQELAAKELAVEQFRQECIEAVDQPTLAERRVERLRRHWLQRCRVQAKELDRLAIVLKSESRQLDERFELAQKRESKNEQIRRDLDDMTAIAELHHMLAGSERDQTERDSQEWEHERRWLYERLRMAREAWESLAAILVEPSLTSDFQAA